MLTCCVPWCYLNWMTWHCYWSTKATTRYSNPWKTRPYHTLAEPANHCREAARTALVSIYSLCCAAKSLRTKSNSIARIHLPTQAFRTKYSQNITRTNFLPTPHPNPIPHYKVSHKIGEWLQGNILTNLVLKKRIKYLQFKNENWTQKTSGTIYHELFDRKAKYQLNFPKLLYKFSLILIIIHMELLNYVFQILKKNK